MSASICPFKEIVRRLNGIEPGHGAKLVHLRGRIVAHSDRTDLTLVAEILERSRRFRNRRLEVRPVHLIKVNVVRAQPAQ
jgi:hypothetical protein